MANGLSLPDGTFQPFRAEDMSTQLATRQNVGITLGDLGGWLDVLSEVTKPAERKTERVSRHVCETVASTSMDSGMSSAMALDSEATPTPRQTCLPKSCTDDQVAAMPVGRSR